MFSKTDQKTFNVKDVPAADFIVAYAEYLKKNDKINIPKWYDFIKSGVGKELAPLDEDWIYIRAASIARKLYMRGHLGVNYLRHIYGANQRYGVSRPHHRKAAGKIIRLAKKPGDTKRLGNTKSVKLREDWEDVKIGIMEKCVKEKFLQNEDILKLLLETGDKKLVEHTENDKTWGDGGDGSGKNLQGKVLMKIRDEIKKEKNEKK